MKKNPLCWAQCLNKESGLVESFASSTKGFVNRDFTLGN